MIQLILNKKYDDVVPIVIAWRFWSQIYENKRAIFAIMKGSRIGPHYSREKMKIVNKFMMTLILSLALIVFVSQPSVFAKKKADPEALKTQTVKACQKEYSDETKNKSDDEIMEWIEKEERGANAGKFKKSKCYDLHEKWEDANGHHEAGEESEHGKK